MRFRRRIRLAPGISLNLSGSGVSATIGPRGSSLTFGRKGVHQNLSIPGTGLYHRSKLSGSAAKGSKRPAANVPILAGVRIDFDGGPIVLLDGDDEAIPSDLVARHWAKWKGVILPSIESALAERNAQTLAMGNLHHQTPAPEPALTLVPVQPPPPPAAPSPRAYHWLWRYLPWHRSKVDEANAAAEGAHAEVLGRWQIEREALQARECERQAAFDARNTDEAGVEAFLGLHLAGLSWPLETLVSVEASSRGSRVAIDIDLPEIEMLPLGLCELAARGREVRIKPFSDTARGRLYQGVVHGTVFRLVGEVFHAIPRVETVIASGYSQRPDPATGQVRDDYLLSVVVRRSDWAGLAFDRLDALDPAEALSALGSRSRLSRGQFAPITPFEAEP